MKTYIIKTFENEYYCGKTNNLNKRIKEHSNPNKNSWFNDKNRRKFEVIYLFDDDYEKYIKQCGVKRIVMLLKALLPSTIRSGGG